MLRAILLASPIVLVAVVSCGDSSTSFDDVSGGSAGTSSSIGGASNGGKSSQAGSSSKGGTASTAGSSSKGGTTSAGGSSSKGGQGNGSGGSNNTGGTKNSAGNANGGTATQGGGAPRGGAANAGAPTEPGGAANAGAPGAGGSGGSGLPDAQCPDLFGTYKIKNKDGMCSGLNKDAPQSIEGTTAACAAHFVSDPPSGAQGVNGAASIDAEGNFTGAMLYLDMTQRSPCSGIWDEVDQTMTVECGGPGDLCTVLLELQ